MNSNSKLSYAIAAILSGTAIGAVHAAATAPAAADTGDQLQTITVTAQRRTENIQNVPITIQALTSESLKQLNVTTFDDLAKYVPNLSLSTNGPAQGNIFMRGLALGSAGTQSSGTIGLYPNVAVYLDDQSGQLPGRNLDIYAADLQRVEILEGPQGTLFGGGAQAGVLRYITNKPKLDKFEGNAEAMYGVTAHGDPNSGFSAVLNLPLINDTLALRAVLYNEDRGGYINNVPSTFTRRNTDLGIYYAGYKAVGGVCPDGLPNNGYCVPPGSAAVNNYGIAQRAINPVKYQGGRLEALWKINDDWNVLITQMYQDINADGVFYQMPKSSDGATLNPLEVSLFQPSYDKDKFENTAWTVNGKVGPISAVYTGGYLVRNVNQVQDYTNYARGVYADYYQCYGASTCGSPLATWQEQEKNTHLTQELRFSTPSDWRTRAIAGVYWEDLSIQDQTDWNYKSLPNCPSSGSTTGYACLGAVAPGAGATLNDPSVRPSNDAFFEDTTKGYKQTAVFASVDYDIIPKVLTVTGGGRWYSYKLDQRGWVGSSFYCYQVASPCTAGGTNMNAENLNAVFKGEKWRGNITWHVTPDVMLYYTFSQGYRPGGFNRASGTALLGTDVYTAANAPSPSAIGKNIPQYVKPLTFSPDTLTNNEIGFKTEFLDHRVQLNGSIYKEDWKNVQTALFNPGVLGNLTLATNGANYQVKGAELQLTARATRRLTLIGSISYNDAKQVNSPFLIDSNPASANYGKPITQYVFRGAVKSITNTFGNPNTPTAYSPKVQANMRARYDWSMNEYNYFVQAGAVYVGSMYNNTNTDPTLNGDNPANLQAINTTLFRFAQPSYTTYDASFGVAKDAWSVTIFGDNLNNSNASTFTSTAQFIETQVPLRPRVLGVRVGMKF
ncbi:MAG: TonB-dependent receptor [Gammaproteobacteria bacterium]|nr:TonB-dependent receptor [Gammaproteobacteria bacterium]